MLSVLESEGGRPIEGDSAGMGFGIRSVATVEAEGFVFHDVGIISIDFEP